MKNIKVVRYASDNKALWDDFVKSSKNGTFLHQRDYMEYHADRFDDHSLLFFEKNTLLAIMPGHVKEGIYSSHSGLTFAGVISGNRITTAKMLNVFNVLIPYLKENGIKKLWYKPVPHIYHSAPAEEDLYALFRYNAQLVDRNISAVINPKKVIPSRRTKKSEIRIASKNVAIRESKDYATFMLLLQQLLQDKYGTKPIHSIEEIELLASRFPDHIKLYGAFYKDEMVAGNIIYISRNVAYPQHIAATEAGKKMDASSVLTDFLIKKYTSEDKCYSLGTSNEDGGRKLNESLIQSKESFGARAVTYDAYELSLEQ